MRVTLRDIAEAAQVSLTTVSKVLNGKAVEARIGPECAQRVQRCAERLGYRQNAAAKATAMGRFDCLALVKVHGQGIGLGQLPEGLLNGIERRAAERGQRLSFLALPAEGEADAGAGGDDHGDDEALPRAFRQAWADGLLLFAPWRLLPAARAAIERLALPAVRIGIEQSHDAVYADEGAAAREAVEHLLALGHRRIVYVPDPHLEAAAQRARADAYHAAMRAAGVTPRVVELPAQRRRVEVVPYAAGVAAREALLAGSERPTAVLLDSVELALPLQHVAARLGLELGRDLSLVTFHDVIANHLGPSLTTMLLHTDTLGVAAVDLLLERIAAGGRSRPAVVEHYHLVPGHSSGAPAR